ncbi:hypothetical protein ACFVVX_14710 [Kitasatospora sp. NPDC058170]|uniref:hypothetical protein n=1 Tax=Kitasatospora sp. NPDC058170 TaxID=3346364 RepID=UPI0036DB4B19
MWLWMFLGWVYLLAPLACWAGLVRTRVVGAAVLAVLTGLATVLVGLEYEWFFSRAAAEAEAGYPYAAALVILLGALVERRLRGPRPEGQARRREVGASIALTALALVGVAIAGLYSIARFEPFAPNPAELRLPPGLTIERDSGSDGSCGLHACVRDLSIGSTEGLPAAEIARRLRAGLAADGWTAGPRNSLLRPHGWLLDKRVTELYITELPESVTVELAGPDGVDRAARLLVPGP